MYKITVTVLSDGIPPTNGKIEHWLNYRNSNETILTVNNHQYVIHKTLQVLYYIDEPTKYPYCKTDNKLFSSGHDLVFINRRFNWELENH